MEIKLNMLNENIDDDITKIYKLEINQGKYTTNDENYGKRIRNMIIRSKELMCTEVFTSY